MSHRHPLIGLGGCPRDLPNPYVPTAILDSFVVVRHIGHIAVEKRLFANSVTTPHPPRKIKKQASISSGRPQTRRPSDSPHNHEADSTATSSAVIR
jgi:hypothetical protein